MPVDLPLLQVSSTYFGSFGSAGLPPWLLVLFVLAVAGGIAYVVVRMRKDPKRATTPAQQQRYTHRAFLRAARAAGLSKEQAAMLEKLTEVCKAKQPLLVFSSPSVLDDVLKRGVYALESSGLPEPKRQAQLRLIYTTKQRIENSGSEGGGNAARSTHALKPGQMMAVSTEGSPRFRVKLVANMREVLAVTTPHDAGGKEQRWAKGTRCSVGSGNDNGGGVSFASKVMGYNTIRGVVCMLLQHGNTARQEQQRRSRRKQLSRPCYCYPVRIVQSGTGRRAERKAVVQQNGKIMGTISDISAGGCSVRARAPLKAGTLVKVELSITRRDTLGAFGKVLRVQNEHQGGMMHVMFTRMSANSLNRIYSYVYDYTAMG